MGNRAVLCDDDALVRTVIRRLLEDVGWVVVGEAETSEEARAALTDDGIDLVVLDLALRAGNGEDLLTRLIRDDRTTRAVVFSAYIADAARLLDRGAAAVVEKPDFARLEEVAKNLLARPGASVADRRRPLERPVPDLPRPSGLTLSGLEAWDSWRTALDRLVPGDAVLALDVAADAGQRDVWDHVYQTDFRVAVARAAGSVRRQDERVTISPAGPPVMMIVAGRLEAPTALFGRLEQAWQREVAAGAPIGAFGHVTPDRPAAEVLDRVLDVLADDPPDRSTPLRMV